MVEAKAKARGLQGQGQGQRSSRPRPGVFEAKAKATKVCPWGVLEVEASPRGPPYLGFFYHARLRRELVYKVLYLWYWVLYLLTILKNSTSYGQISKPKSRPRIVEAKAKARGLRGQGQGHAILSSRCPRGRGQSSRTPSLQPSRKPWMLACFMGVTHAQETCTRNLHRCMWPKSCGLIGRLCLKVSGSRNLHGIEQRSVRCKFLIQVYSACVTSFSVLVTSELCGWCSSEAVPGAECDDDHWWLWRNNTLQVDAVLA